MSAPERDLAEAEINLAKWLDSKLAGASDIAVTNLRRPQGSGFSNDTLLAQLAYRLDGASIEKDIVLRVSPTGFPVFPFYDIPQQFDVMQALATHSDIPVPTCLWKEYDKSILGETFYVMEFLDGKVPSDSPPYHMEGFVVDASPEQRRALWMNGIARMAELHKLDYRDAGLGFLAWPDQSRSAIEQHLEYYEHYFLWAARGKPQPVAEYALDWLKKNMPTGERDGIIWGDSRFGNMMYSGDQVLAVLDWEMIAIGNPEADIAWWLFVDWCLQRGNGNPAQAGDRPEGMPSDEETIAYYEACVGRPVEHLKYYQVFAGFRFACVMIRIMQQQASYGTIPPELAEALERNNAVTQLIAELLDLPAPE